MTPGIDLSIVFADEHLLELRVWASNGRFAGQADLYTPLDAPADLAAVLRAFPSSTTDRRDFELGTREDRSRVQLRFSCSDSLGHVVAEVDLCSSPLGGTGPESARFRVQVEPAGIDAFVRELREMARTV